MPEEEAKGLLAIWARIDSDYVVEYRKWQNCAPAGRPLIY